MGDGRVRRRLRLRLGLRLLATVGDGCGDARREGGERLPSVRALAAAIGVHRNTAAAVYRDLERFGLVRCVRGAGTFVAGPPEPSWMRAGDPVCSDPTLASVLAAELPRRVGVTASGGRCPLLVPLDETPPAGRLVVPVAPCGPALRALGRLRPGSTVLLVSDSPRLGRLVRNTLVALHGDSVGLARAAPARPEPGVPGIDLGLVDLRQFARSGTGIGLEGLIPLRLVVGPGLETG
ncbi:MAG: GntR family transcriptional regulator [Gemmatimonadota bacterium]